MHGGGFSVPVVLIIFNRPEVALHTFLEIAKMKPTKLLVIGDGPRKNVPGENEKVMQARAVIQMIDWDCEVLTHFSEENLGCKKRVSSGLDWAFSLVDEAIILEDDCLPNRSFFLFCEEMLIKYRHQKEVGMIAGINFQNGIKRGEADYYFSKYMHIWGWASWRNRWQESYDVKMREWPRYRDSLEFEAITGSASQKRFWGSIFEKVYQGKIDTWDYQWVFANWQRKRLCIIPGKNLISNRGFGKGATHTIVESELANLPTHEMHFPLKHPQLIEANLMADQYTEKNYFSANRLNRFARMIKKLLRGIL
jgi:hypothetical protein